MEKFGYGINIPDQQHWINLGSLFTTVTLCDPTVFFGVGNQSISYFFRSWRIFVIEFRLPVNTNVPDVVVMLSMHYIESNAVFDQCI